jgi:multicomponent K+:H+ antiporter subunit A
MTLDLIGLPLIALLPFFGAAMVAYLASAHRLASAWGAGIVTIMALLLLSQLAPIPFGGETLVQSWVWIESIGLNFSFRLDGLGLLFAYIIMGIGLLIIIYARYYLSANDCMGRFYSYLLMFMGSMVGIVLSENILQLVVFWELTSLSSFLLISFWQHKKEGRDGAMMALVITGAGGLALLAGMLLLGYIAGSYELSTVLASRETIINHSLFTPMILLVLIGVLTKSAQFPFHFWLPHAMAAPTPVSAYLHSATMVKAGIFLLARLFPVLSGTAEWIVIVTCAGMITLLLGAFTAFFKHDLKGLLAYSTISHLGLVTLLFGFSSPLAAVAAVFHIINHATFKASLFMVAGIVDHETGTRDMRRLGGLLRFMPHTATLAMVASAAMAGVPLLNGFLSKEMFFERAIVDGMPLSLILPVLATLGGVFSVAYSLRFVADVFLGQKNELPKEPHEPPRFMKIPVDILVVLCLAVGIVPMVVVAPILASAVLGTLQSPLPQYSLALWHGFNMPLTMSIIAFVLGILMYTKKATLFTWYERVLSRVDARIPYGMVVEWSFDVAEKVNSFLHRGIMRPSVYGFVIAALCVGVAGFSYSDAPILGQREFLSLDWISIIVTIILVISTFATLYLHRQRLIALVILGIIGLIVSLVFIKFSAPDLALTQLSVEVVTVVLMLLALYYLPPFTPKESSPVKLRSDIILSLLGGVGVFILTLAVLSRDYTTIGDYFLANSLTGGGGTNVVNVILVDFRGFDTLGEITVLGIAGIGIFALLQGLRLFAPPKDARGFSWSSDVHPPIMQALMRLLLPVMLLVAVYIFLRGHNLPGGGFIAGLIAAVALIVQYLANGIEWSGKRLNFDKHFLIGSGILIATLTGAVSMVIGYPFLTSTFTHVHWPIVGDFEIASAMAFDLGVFLVVVGATVMILVQLGKLSLTSHKLTQTLEDNKEE